MSRFDSNVPRWTTTTSAPNNDIETQLVEFWQELLGISSVGIHDSFFDLGGHSLVAVRLFSKIKSAWNVSLPVGTLFEAPTIYELAKLIPVVQARRTTASTATAEYHTSEASPEWTSLVPIRKTGSRPPLFCVAGKGGNPLNLRYLATRLGDDQPFYGIQHRGVDGVLPPHKSIEEMARACIRDIRSVQPHGPYLLGGYSAGGLVAFEMARALKASGEVVAMLALIDTWDPAYAELDGIRRLAMHLKMMGCRGVGYLYQKIRDRVDHYFLRSGDNNRSVVGEQKSNRADSLQQANVQAWKAMEEKYVVRPFDGNGLLFRPYRTMDVDWSSLRHGNEFNGWDKFLLGGIDVVQVPGGHLTMCEEPHVRILAKRFAHAISKRLATIEMESQGVGSMVR